MKPSELLTKYLFWIGWKGKLPEGTFKHIDENLISKEQARKELKKMVYKNCKYRDYERKKWFNMIDEVFNEITNKR